MNDLKLSLEKYGIWILAKQLGRNSPDEFLIDDENLRKARELVKDKSINPDYTPDTKKKAKNNFFFCQTS